MVLVGVGFWNIEKHEKTRKGFLSLAWRKTLNLLSLRLKVILHRKTRKTLKAFLLRLKVILHRKARKTRKGLLGCLFVAWRKMRKWKCASLFLLFLNIERLERHERCFLSVAWRKALNLLSLRLKVILHRKTRKARKVIIVYCLAKNTKSFAASLKSNFTSKNSKDSKGFLASLKGNFTSKDSKNTKGVLVYCLAKNAKRKCASLFLWV